MRLQLLIFLTALLQLTPTLSQAAERHALVIGNSKYTELALKNPANDATDMAAQLKAMGYKIYSGMALLDLDRASMEQAIDGFAQSLPSDASAVFYYAGHGMSTDSDNYLLPVNSSLKFHSQLKDRTIGLRSIVELLSSYNPSGANIFLLDACRNNPLARSFRSVNRGLQKLEGVPRGVFIGYAAEHGQVADDNLEEKNGTYTGQLLKNMAANPNLSIEALHEQVANSVYEQTNGDQFPVSEDRIYGKWCFAECGASALSIQSSSATRTEFPPITEKPAMDIAITPKRNYWKIGGGVILGVIAVSLAMDDDGPTEPPRQVGFQLDPPGQ